MNLKMFQVDAFASRPFEGNPAAVVPLAEWLTDEVMLRIAGENNLSETAFFVPENGGYHIRWFTPELEVDLCGHATLAASHVIFSELGLEDALIRFHSDRSGELSVAKDGDRLVLDFPAYPMKETEPIAILAEALGAKPLRTWESQGNMVFLLMESEGQIRAMKPDLSLIAQVPFDEVIVTARGETADIASRMFAPRIGIPEDPVTGAIHCSLIPYWAEELGKKKLIARQVSKRGGELYCELAGDRVKIAGNAVTFLRGEINIEGHSPQRAQSAQSN